ncbi:MAG: fibronectin type III domain-containing protein, partial [Mycobacteriales bacterium]
LGDRAVRVVNADGGDGTCTCTFGVANVPNAPANPHTTSGDHSLVVAWSAPTSDGGSAITSYEVTLSKDGAVVGQPIQVPADANPLQAPFTGLVNGATYVAGIVANNGVGASSTASTSGVPYGLPTAPANVTATAGDTAATVSWSAASPNGNAISSYRVTASPGGNRVSVTGTHATVTGLTNGTQYTFTVAAENAAGYGPESAASNAVIPRLTTRLTSGASPRVVTYGSYMTFSGKLTRASNGAALAGRTVRLTLTPDVGSSVNKYLTTSSTGVWTFTTRPTYNTTVRTAFLGDSSYLPVGVPAYRAFVATRVVVSSPRSGASSSASTPLVVTGYATPNKSGATIYLDVYTSSGPRTLARAVVASNGTYRFSVNLGRGTYKLRVGIGAVRGNATGFSGPFYVKRV